MHPPKQKSAEKNTRLAQPQPRKKRVRLTPEVRRQQILDAALVEFSSLGFTAASISRIANRAGTSKANLYVHFANKDEIFETLLKSLLIPENSLWASIEPGTSLDERIDTFIEQTYDGLTPEVISILRLLISESHRIPDLIQRWHAETIEPARAEQQQRIDQYVAEGQLQSTPLTDYFGFVMAPLLYAAITRMVFREDIADDECHKIKETHRKMLQFLLVPPRDTGAPGIKKKPTSPDR